MLRFGLSPDYVLDKIESYEIKALLEHQHMKDKESWEQARLIAYITAQANSKKKLTLQSIIKFPWENESKKQKPEMMSDKDLSRLKAAAQQFINNNNITNTDNING